MAMLARPGAAPVSARRRPMIRALVLTASYGSGHNEAARSVAAAFRREGCQAVTVDHFRDLVHPAFERITRAIYYAVLQGAPAAWGLAYGLADRLATDSRLTLGLTRVGAARLTRLLERLAPDVVVTVHATPAVAMSWLARRGVRLPAHTTVVTDFVAHSQWIAPAIDRYCVPAEEVKHEFVARGIPARKVVVTGMPLRAEFDEPVDAASARAELDLDTAVPVVLAMAGSRGSLGRLPDVLQALAALGDRVQGLVVTGHDPRLAGRLRSLACASRVRVLGHVRAVRRLMAAADLLVSKPGGMTVAEAVAAELPLVSYGALPGQERRNERFVSRAGVALVARSRADLGQALSRALEDPALLELLRERMRGLRRPDAARHVVKVALERDALPW
jgi:processive 1,2-diacylglycerol beta-glucosyltransferase